MKGTGMIKGKNGRKILEEGNMNEKNPSLTTADTGKEIHGVGGASEVISFLESDDTHTQENKEILGK